MLVPDRLKKPSQSKKRRVEDLFLRTETEEELPFYDVREAFTEDRCQKIFERLQECLSQKNWEDFSNIIVGFATVFPDFHFPEEYTSEELFEEINAMPLFGYKRNGEMNMKNPFELLRAVTVLFPHRAAEFRAKFSFDQQKNDVDTLRVANHHATLFYGSAFYLALLDPTRISECGANRETFEKVKKELADIRTDSFEDFIIPAGSVAALSYPSFREELLADRSLSVRSKKLLDQLAHIQEWARFTYAAENIDFLFSDHVEFPQPGVTRVIRSEKKLLSKTPLPQEQEY